MSRTSWPAPRTSPPGPSPPAVAKEDNVKRKIFFTACEIFLPVNTCRK